MNTMMSILSENIIGITLVSIALMTYLYLRKAFNYFEDRGLPYVKPSWQKFFKSFTLESFNQTPNDIYEKEKGSNSCIGFFHSGCIPALVVLDASVAKDILIKDFSHFQNHGFEQDTTSDPLGKHLFNMKDDEWRTLRHKLVPTFSAGKLKDMVPLIEDCAEDLIQEMEDDKQLTRDVNMSNLFKKYSLAMIAKCAFGIDPNNIKNPDSEFQILLRRVLNPTFTDRLRILILFMSPDLFSWLKLKMFPESVESFILKLTKDVLNMRRETGVKRNDFIQLLLELKDKGNVEMENEKYDNKHLETVNTLEMTHELLSAQVFIFLLAGYENISWAITVTAYALSKHPDIQTRVRQELKSIRDNYPTTDYSALKEMKYLGACIDEAMRIYTSQSLIVRECTKPYMFKDGKKIERGTNILIPAKAIQTDERYWPDPMQYNPDRFLDKSNIHQASYLPFGDGPRICIAQRLALMTVRAMLAKLIENFEILPSPKTQEPIKIDVTVLSTIRGGAWATFKPLKTRVN